MSSAPGGSVNESKSQLNQPPSATRSGSLERTDCQPISGVSARNDLPPATRASSWPPKQRPSTGTSASSASFSSLASREMNGLVSSNAANSDPSDAIMS